MSSAVETSAPAAQTTDGLPSLTSWSGRRKYPCAWWPAIRGCVGRPVPRSRSGVRILRRNSVASACFVAASTIRPSTK
jgi:hypothetical protein